MNLDAARYERSARVLTPISARPGDKSFVEKIRNGHFFASREAMIYWNSQCVGFSNLPRSQTLSSPGIGYPMTLPERNPAP